MKFILCVEKTMGLLFFGKRQSEDRSLREWILNYTSGSKLFMSQYSAKQFADEQGFSIDDDYLLIADENDYCFVEDKGYDLSGCNEVVLCNWNRRYPADKFFNEDLKGLGFKKIKKQEIKGSSHDKITIEIYKRG